LKTFHKKTLLCKIGSSYLILRAKYERGLLQRLSDAMNSKVIEWVFILLIVIYTLLVFVTIVLDDGCTNSDNVNKALDVLKIVELVIISIFILEIMLRVIGSGFKVN
jgi:hypothetical protein